MAPTDEPPISIIDTYGLRTVTEKDVRAALRIVEGQRPPDDAAKKDAETRLAAVAGVRSAALASVCCDNGGSILYVGIEEDGSPVWTSRPAPTGAVRLPAEILKAADDYDAAIMRAVMSGRSKEDDSEGHARSEDPAARAIEDAFIAYAAKSLALLRSVLRESSDERHRALAAQVIAYSPDKAAVAGDLIAAIDDPSDEVRNNAVRALAVMAMGRDTLRLHVPVVSLVRLLNSPVWTDRNKAAMALYLVSEKRDPKLLAALRGSAMPALVEMARWKSQGHSLPAFFLLGRATEQTDGPIGEAWEKGDRESVIRAALQRQ